MSYLFNLILTNRPNLKTTDYIISILLCDLMTSSPPCWLYDNVHCLSTMSALWQCNSPSPLHHHISFMSTYTSSPPCQLYVDVHFFTTTSTLWWCNFFHTPPLALLSLHSWRLQIYIYIYIYIYTLNGISIIKI